MMRKLTILFISILLINGCIIEEDTLDEEVIDGGSIQKFQLVILDLDNLTQDTYQGYMDGFTVDLMKTDQNTLAFFVGEGISLGENALEIYDLGVTINYTVEETVLQNSLQNSIDNLTANFNTYANSLTNNTTKEIAVKSVMENFNATLSELNESERETIALVYQANKDFFDNLYQTDYTVPQGRNIAANYSNLSNGQLIKNFAKSTIGAGIATAGAVLSFSSGNFLITLPFVVAAYPLWQITADLLEEILINRLWVYTQLQWDNVVSSITNSNRMMLNGLEFQNGVAKTLNFDIDLRGFSIADSSSTNPVFSSFFSSFSNFNEIIDDLNNMIDFVNNIPLVDIGFLDNVSINNPSQETINITQSLFNNFSFTINDSNLQMSNPTLANGNISFTITILDETLVTDYIDTTISYSYNDETNSFSGSFPVRVFMSEIEIDLSGIWKMQFNSQSCSQGNIPSGVIAEFVFNPNNTITFVGFYESMNDGTAVQNNYQLADSNLSINWHRIDTGYSSDLCQGQYYDYSIDESIVFNGTSQNTTEFIGNYSNTSLETPYYPCAENLDCTGVMRIFK